MLSRPRRPKPPLGSWTTIARLWKRSTWNGITAHEERAGILEHDAGLPRPEAKFEAAKITATYVRNRGLSMVGATGGPGELPRLSQVPDTPARVDRLPLGV